MNRIKTEKAEQWLLEAAEFLLKWIALPVSASLFTVFLVKNAGSARVLGSGLSILVFSGLFSIVKLHNLKLQRRD